MHLEVRRIIKTESSENKLWVVECNGTPRSGKGTITAGLAESLPGSAQDETGADYRAVTFGLIHDGLIKQTMSDQTIKQIIEKLPDDQASSYAAQRYEIIKEHGSKALYSQEVADLVARISPHPLIRAAVKSGFKKRVKKHAENPDIMLLFVDGRNLSSVITSIPEAQVLLRIFVDCQPLVAAQREAVRQNIDLNEPENEKWFEDTYSSIKVRQKSDERRGNDPVCPDDNSINYWFNTSILQETIKHASLRGNMTTAQAATMITAHPEDFRKDGRDGAGAKAFVENRQVYYDTSETTKDSMVEFAKRMVDEALDQNAGIYQSHSGQLFE